MSDLPEKGYINIKAFSFIDWNNPLTKHCLRKHGDMIAKLETTPYAGFDMAAPGVESRSAVVYACSFCGTFAQSDDQLCEHIRPRKAAKKELSPAELLSLENFNDHIYESLRKWREDKNSIVRLPVMSNKIKPGEQMLLRLGMTYRQAACLAAAVDGIMIMRLGLRGSEVDFIIKHADELWFSAYSFVRKDITPWSPSITDLLANDWYAYVGSDRAEDFADLGMLPQMVDAPVPFDSMYLAASAFVPDKKTPDEMDEDFREAYTAYLQTLAPAHVLKRMIEDDKPSSPALASSKLLQGSKARVIGIGRPLDAKRDLHRALPDGHKWHESDHFADLEGMLATPISRESGAVVTEAILVEHGSFTIHVAVGTALHVREVVDGPKGVQCLVDLELVGLNGGKVNLAALVSATHLKSRAAYEAHQFINTKTNESI